MRKALKLSLLTFLFLLNQSYVFGQSYTITKVGELILETDEIITDGIITKYFGMNVDGLGDSKLKVTIGSYSYIKSYEFKLSATQLYSYLFANNLAEDVAIAFRRGVFGNVTVSILHEDGTLSDETTISLNVTKPRSNCKKYTSNRLKKCTRVDLSKASAAQKKKLANEFLSSIKGPIVLEP